METNESTPKKEFVSTALPSQMKQIRLDALDKANLEGLERFLQVKDPRSFINLAIKNRNVLQLVILKLNVVLVNLLIEHGADARSTSENSDTCLHLATETGNLELIELFSKQVEMNSLNESNRSPSHVAAVESKHNAANFLIQKEMLTLTGLTPLLEATEYKHRSLIELLLNAGTNPNTPGPNGILAF